MQEGVLHLIVGVLRALGKLDKAVYVNINVLHRFTVLVLVMLEGWCCWHGTLCDKDGGGLVCNACCLCSAWGFSKFGKLMIVG